MDRRTRGWFVSWLCFSTACVGALEAPPGPRAAPPVTVDFECRDHAPVAAPPLRRLSSREYAATVRSVLSRFYAPSEVEAIAAEVVLDQHVPTDTRVDAATAPGHFLFDGASQDVTHELVEAQVEIALALGSALTGTTARLEQLAGPCAIDMDNGNDATCLDDLVANLGMLTHRRPLTSDEQAFFRDQVYIDGSVVVRVGIAELVSVLFVQPSFVFHVEGTGGLTAYELAARLSYQFWGTMPDDSLFMAAASGALRTDDGFANATRSVVEDVRAREGLRRFARTWLRLEELAPSDASSTPRLEAIRAGLLVGPSFDLAVQNELVDGFADAVQEGLTFREFFLSDTTTTSDPTLAGIYGVAPSGGAAVALPPERHGLLARVGMLLPRSSTGNLYDPTHLSDDSHPVLRGTLIARQIACVDVPEPEASAVDEGLARLAALRPDTTTRERYARTTGACGGACHATLNSFGFALEGFDPFGRLRVEEPWFDGDLVQGQLAIDSRVGLQFTAGASSASLGTVDSPSVLGQRLYETGVAGACFSRHYLRFLLHRLEDVAADGCLLEELDEGIDEDAPLYDVLTRPLLSPSYRTREGT